jgi:hypothetical protein
LAVGDFFAGFADGEEIGVVVPEEAALAEVFEGLEGYHGFVGVVVEGVFVGFIGEGREDGAVGCDAEVFLQALDNGDAECFVSDLSLSVLVGSIEFGLATFIT